MLGQPALVARHARGDPQGEALLAQERIAAVAAAVRPDGAFLGEVDDVLLLGVAGPGDVLLPGPQGHADRVDAGDEEAVAQGVEHRAAHAGHDPHRDHDVGRVGHLHADVGDRRADRSHAEGDDVHGPAAHAAVEKVPAGSASWRWARPSCWSARRRRSGGCRRTSGPRPGPRPSGRRGPGSCWAVSPGSAGETSLACTSSSQSRSYSSCEPSHQTTSSGWQRSAICSIHGRSCGRSMLTAGRIPEMTGAVVDIIGSLLTLRSQCPVTVKGP